MRGQVIGTTMPHGFAGSYSRQPDMIVDTHPATGAIAFGAAVVYDGTNGVKTAGTGATAAGFVGVAVREVKSATDYLNQNVGSYVQYDAVPVMKRGRVNVLCQRGTPALNGAVYVRIAANASYPNAVVGGFEAAADGDNTIALTNCKWRGPADANGVAELAILTMQNA